MNAHKQLFSDLAIRICTIIVFIIGLNHQHQHAANGCKLDVTIHIQLLCNHSRAIVIEQAIPAWRRLSSIMNLELIPYGNSRTLIGNYSMLPPPQMAFKCQHGNRECSGNALMGCALKTLPKEYGIAFVDCMFRHDLWWKPDISAPCCARQLDIDWRFLERCSQSAFGKNIQWLNGRKVHALRPKMRHVPWVLTDGKYSKVNERAAFTNMIEYVCDTYRGYKPDICNETIVERVVPTRLGFTKRNASVEAIVLVKNQTILPNIPHHSHAPGPGIGTNYTLPVPELKVINATVARDIMLQSAQADDYNHQATTTPHIRLRPINESANNTLNNNKTTGADGNRIISLVPITTTTTPCGPVQHTTPVPTTTPCGPVEHTTPVPTTTPCGPVQHTTPVPTPTTTPCGPVPHTTPVPALTTTPCGPVIHKNLFDTTGHNKSVQTTPKPGDFDLDEFEDVGVDRNPKQSNLTSGPTTVSPTVTKGHVATTYAQSSSSLVDNGVIMVQKTINATNPTKVNNTAINSTANDKKNNMNISLTTNSTTITTTPNINKQTPKNNCTVGGGDDHVLKSNQGEDDPDEEESDDSIQRTRPVPVRNDSSISNKTDPNVRIHLRNLIPHNQSTTALPIITTTTKTTTTTTPIITTTTHPTTTTTPRVTTTTPAATTRVTTTPRTTTRVTTTTPVATTTVTTTPTTTTRVTTTPTTTTRVTTTTTMATTIVTTTPTTTTRVTTTTPTTTTRVTTTTPTTTTRVTTTTPTTTTRVTTTTPITTTKLTTTTPAATTTTPLATTTVSTTTPTITTKVPTTIPAFTTTAFATITLRPTPLAYNPYDMHYTSCNDTVNNATKSTGAALPVMYINQAKTETHDHHNHHHDSHDHHKHPHQHDKHEHVHSGHPEFLPDPASANDKALTDEESLLLMS